MDQEWQFAGSSKEGEPFEIRGRNVWDQGWQVSAGQEAHVHDPVYGQAFVFRVYTIQDGGEKDRVCRRRVLKRRMGILYARVSATR